MKTQMKSIALIAGVLVTGALCSAPAFAADPMLSTGGYARQLHKLDMMKMLDADGNHMVTSAEFDSYYGKVFDELNKDGDDTLDAKEWVGNKDDQKVSIATGGYSRELRSMKIMGKIDGNGDHLVTKNEFIAFHQKLFTAMDKSGDQQLDPQEWLAKQVGN